MVIRTLQISVVLALLTGITGCKQEAKETVPSVTSSINVASPFEGEIQCREFNDGLVYNSAFAEVFSLDLEKAVDMDPGLMAARVYWTEMINHPGSPKMQMQLYLEPHVNLQFPKDEGTHNGIEALVRSGFRYFSHTPYAYPDSNDEFNFRYVIQDGDELMSAYLYRYRTNLTSRGIQAIELGTTFNRNPIVYLYIGEDDPLNSGRGQLSHDLAAGKSHDPERFLKLRIPSELQPIMQAPYRACQGDTAQR